ncbi:GT-D fold domain-containing glycosyltransferase [Crystallibacter crystallopoietes]|uniref:GT-D fold domain-containing glycosyltransferase n=1 Tax=Crystallibacter crystallopoietes TaxID=37928 RepID=UPI00167F3530|nr:GT-D fold domain-containing glycosyltransferase [Arthrobacter crystallopoietes]
MPLAKRLKRLLTGAAAEKVAALRKQTALLERQNELLAEQNRILRDAVDGPMAKTFLETKRMRDAVENIRHVSMAPLRREIADVLQARQLGFMATIDALRDERKSLARFGDGEFRLMYRLEHKLKFQRNSPELMLALQRVLTMPSAHTLVGMPQVFVGAHWSIVFAETWHFVGPMVATQERFGNSHVTRPMFFHQHGQQAVEAWRSVWEGRDAVVVSGQGSRFDLVPALFDNLGSVREVFSTPTDAFFDLDRLVGEVEDTGRDLVLLSLGPAATVAADMLAAKGIQALDIGHLSSSYENVLLGADLPEHVPPVRVP